MVAKLDNMKTGEKISQNRKESGYYYSFQGYAVSGGKVDRFADVRLYHPGRYGDSPTYCCLWISGESVYGSGGGKAGGYGYHKGSAAMMRALDDAGIELFKEDGTTREYIDGVGESAMNETIKAIGVALGYNLDTIAVYTAHA